MYGCVYVCVSVCGWVGGCEWCKWEGRWCVGGHQADISVRGVCVFHMCTCEGGGGGGECGKEVWCVSGVHV